MEDRTESAIAQQVMKSISYLNNAFYNVIHAMDVANTALGEGKEGIVGEFTLAHEWDVYEDKMKHKKDQKMSMLLTGGTVLAALAGLPFLPGAGAALISVEAGLEGAALLEAEAKNLKLAKNTLGYFSSSTFAISGGYNFFDQWVSGNDKTDTGE